MVNVSSVVWLMVVVVCSTLASCKDKDGSSATTGDEVSTAVPDRATDALSKPVPSTPYFLRDDKLLRIIDGKTETLLEHPGASYCETDSRGQSIWLLSSAGISVYDVISRSVELVVAAKDDPIKAFEIRFGLDQGKVGNADPLRDDIALVVVATKRISIHSEIICEGEREANCYVETESDDPDLWELQDEAALVKSLYDQIPLHQTAQLTTIAARRLTTFVDEDSPHGVDTPLMKIEGALDCGLMRPPLAAPANE